MIAALVLVVFTAGLERLLPHDVPAAAAPVVVPVPWKSPPPTPPPADCLPSGSGGPCIPFKQLIQQMQKTPEVIPANPAAAKENTI